MRKTCNNKTHPKEYNVWAMMKQRCNNPKAQNYINYGGKGIKYCSEWEVFSNFISDMGECPDKHTLDRVDNTQGYAPDNCRWADVETQQNNKSSSVNITAFGKTQTISQWAREYNIPMYRLHDRIQRLKLHPEEALTRQKMSHNTYEVVQTTVEGEYLTTHKTLASAGTAIGKDRRGIYNVLTGKAKSAYGFGWRYA
jgi:hypothetical protein